MPSAIAEGPRWALLAAPAVALLWTGMLLGVSFLATPIKFTAPSLTLPVALDVGRATFHLLIKAEWVALVLLVVVAAFGRFPLWQFVLAALLGVCLLVQTFGLLPPLDARVAAVIAGETLPRSSLHLAYIAVDVIKLVLLVGSAVTAVVFWRSGATLP